MTKEHKAAALLAKHGDVEVVTRPTPAPGSKEVLVKVTSAASMLVEEYPAVLGTDGAGIIESVGSDVTGLKPGDRVFFQGRYIPDLATFQQYVIADSELLSKIPSNISDDQASTIPVASIPALLAFFQNTGISFPLKGETATRTPVLILGGSSSLGQYAIQIARIAGFNPIVTTSSEQHSEYLKSLGATHVFDRNVDVKTIQSAFPKRVSLVFDTISLSSTQPLAFEVLTTPTIIQGARLAITLPVDPELKGKNEALGRDSITVDHVLGISHLHRELTLPFWSVLENWIETGKYVPNRVQLVPGGLSGVTNGLELSRKGVSGVKLVLQIGK